MVSSWAKRAFPLHFEHEQKVRAYDFLHQITPDRFRSAYHFTSLHSLCLSPTGTEPKTACRAVFQTVAVPFPILGCLWEDGSLRRRNDPFRSLVRPYGGNSPPLLRHHCNFYQHWICQLFPSAQWLPVFKNRLKVHDYILALRSFNLKTSNVIVQPLRH